MLNFSSRTIFFETAFLTITLGDIKRVYVFFMIELFDSQMGKSNVLIL